MAALRLFIAVYWLRHHGAHYALFGAYAVRCATSIRPTGGVAMSTMKKVRESRAEDVTMPHVFQSHDEEYARAARARHLTPTAPGCPRSPAPRVAVCHSIEEHAVVSRRAMPRRCCVARSAFVFARRFVATPVLYPCVFVVALLPRVLVRASPRRRRRRDSCSPMRPLDVMQDFMPHVTDSPAC